MNNKIIAFRIVTSNYCVSTHLSNTLERVPPEIKIFVLGDDVEKFSKIYKNVVFINVPLKRNFHLVYDIVSIYLIIKLILKHKPKIVHSIMTKSGLYTAIFSYILRVKIRIHTFTGQIWSQRKGLSKSLLKFTDRLISILNTHCFTDSKSQSEFLFENGISHKGKIIPHLLNGSIAGVDLKKFNKVKLSKKIDLKYRDQNTFVIGYIARKSIDKGCIDMLEIFSKLLQKTKNIKLLFIGPDESNGEIENFFKKHPKLKNHIVEFGFVNNHYKYILECDLMCLPSHREGFGSIVIDSGALGVPTVGFNIPGLVDSISDNFSGILVPYGDIKAFVDAVYKLINNKDLLKELSINAKKHVINNYDADLVNNELFNFYLNA